MRRVDVEAIKAKAAEIGFDVCGIAGTGDHPKLARLREWIEAGYAGEMAYLAESRDERADVRASMGSARSVISLGTVYNTDVPYSHDRIPDGHVAVARYALGDDYHDVLRTRVRTLLAWLADQAGPGIEAFTCVDDGPVQERVYAEAAGLGWIGKNTCLINPKLGSWLFLSEIVTNLDLRPDAPVPDQCGTCTRCIDACPTGAITEPYTVDATRCLSYLTIEVRASLEESWRGALESRLFGCDICQDVCPWNRKAPVSSDPAWQPREGLPFLRLIDACRATDEEWTTRLKGSAMKRAGLHRVRRTMAYAAAALTPRERREAVEALRAHPSAAAPVVADAIAWAGE
jgi:epoxyqueuosine reductase